MCASTDVGVSSSIVTAKVAEQNRSVRPTLVSDKAVHFSPVTGEKGKSSGYRLSLSALVQICEEKVRERELIYPPVTGGKAIKWLPGCEVVF